MLPQRSAEVLLKLLRSETVVDLARIQAALGGVSAMTCFRYLKQIPYRCSYNCNGRYYCLHEPSRYDRHGLWSWGAVHFSLDGSLRNTVRRIVRESEAGCTHREIELLLRVRVHNTLLDLLRKAELEREQLAQLYVYLHTRPRVRQAQFERRKERIESGKAVVDAQDLEVDDGIVIQVLLVLIHHPASKAADVVRYLRGHLPPITFQQVRAVFSRYDLEDLGEKGGPRSH
jgi:hypothetical protein